MESRKKSIENKMSGLVMMLYIIAIIMLVVTVYTCVVNVSYIIDYASTYGTGVLDMFGDAFQYVLTGSIAYLIYAVLAFAAGKIISIMRKSGLDKEFKVKMEKKALKAVEKAMEAEFAGMDIEMEDDFEDDETTNEEMSWCVAGDNVDTDEYASEEFKGNETEDKDEDDAEVTADDKEK